ncbi:hypothetical protein LZ31DRAFT_560864 [Colletotrichum somersetense]|nr:hypothetical protein LZ31DRAFT_560864 [Colletotrichum somersetense]
MTLGHSDVESRTTQASPSFLPFIARYMRAIDASRGSCIAPPAPLSRPPRMSSNQTVIADLLRLVLEYVDLARKKRKKGKKGRKKKARPNRHPTTRSRAAKSSNPVGFPITHNPQTLWENVLLTNKHKVRGVPGCSKQQKTKQKPTKGVCCRPPDGQSQNHRSCAARFAAAAVRYPVQPKRDGASTASPPSP